MTAADPPRNDRRFIGRDDSDITCSGEVIDALLLRVPLVMLWRGCRQVKAGWQVGTAFGSGQLCQSRGKRAKASWGEFACVVCRPSCRLRLGLVRSQRAMAGFADAAFATAAFHGTRSDLLFAGAGLVYGPVRRHDFLYERQFKLRPLRKSVLDLGNLQGRFLRVRARLRIVHGKLREQLELHRRLVELRPLWKSLLDRRELHRRLLSEVVAVQHSAEHRRESFNLRP